MKGGNPLSIFLLKTTQSMENKGSPDSSGYQASGAQRLKVLWGAVDRGRPRSHEIFGIVMVYAFKYRIGNLVKFVYFVGGGGSGTVIISK